MFDLCECGCGGLVARPDSKITKKQVKDLRLPKDMTLGG